MPHKHELRCVFVIGTYMGEYVCVCVGGGGGISHLILGAFSLKRPFFCVTLHYNYENAGGGIKPQALPPRSAVRDELN